MRRSSLYFEVARFDINTSGSWRFLAVFSENRAFGGQSPPQEGGQYSQGRSSVKRKQAKPADAPAKAGVRLPGAQARSATLPADGNDVGVRAFAAPKRLRPRRRAARPPLNTRAESAIPLIVTRAGVAEW